MSFLKNAIQSIKKAYLSLTGSAEENEAAIAQQRTQLFEALAKASADGDISAAEMDEVVQLQKFLNISDETMNEIKIKVLKDLVTKILSDNIVTTEEVALLQEVGRDLKLSDKDMESLKPDFDKVEALHAQGKA